MHISLVFFFLEEESLRYVVSRVFLYWIAIVLLGIRWKGNLRLFGYLILISIYASLQVVRLPPCADTSMVTVYYLLLLLLCFNNISLGIMVPIIVVVIHL